MTTSVWSNVSLLVGVLALVGVLVTAVVALINARSTTSQAAESARRDAWWDRSQWAMERCYDTNPLAQAIGLTVIGRLGRSQLATAEDREMMREVARTILVEK